MIGTSGRKSGSIIIVTILVGWISMIGQVALLREAAVSFYGVELIYLIAVSLWMLGTGMGALLGKRRCAGGGGTVLWRWLLALGVLAFLETVFLRLLRPLFGGVPGAYLPLFRQFLGLFLALIPPGFLSGAAFQRAAAAYAATDPERTTGGAYAWESLGGGLGGVSATLFPWTGVSNVTAAGFCILLPVCALVFTENPFGKKRAVIVIFILTAVPALFGLQRLDRRLTAVVHPDVIAVRDTPHARVTITRRAGQIVVYENDTPTYETGETDTEAFVHPAAVQRERLKDVLVAGGAMEGLIPEILKHGPRRIDCVISDRRRHQTVMSVLPKPRLSGLTDPRVRLHPDDPRRFLHRKDDRYDLILAGVPEPTSGRTNRFYTREFFRLVRPRLRPGGVYAFRISSTENIWSPSLSRRNQSIHRALTAVFDDTAVLPGGRNLFIASNRPLEKTPKALIDRLTRRKIESKRVTAPYIRYLYTNDRFHRIQEILNRTRVPMNTDAFPVCYRVSTRLWLTRFFPGMIHAEGFSTQTLQWFRMFVLLSALGIPLLICRWTVRRNAGFELFVTGAAAFAGTMLESAVLLYYQVKQGVLFLHIGWLLTAFMGGLAAGGALAARMDLRRKSTWYPRFFFGFCLLGLGFRGIVAGGFEIGLATSTLVTAGAGFLTACVFGAAGRLEGESRIRVIPGLVASDLFGGCLGFLTGSLVFVPYFGTGFSAVIVTVLSTACLICTPRFRTGFRSRYFSLFEKGGNQKG